MEIRATTKMACQAALAIAIAEIITLVLHLERGYWVTLSAMALTTQTWGDNIKRSLERVSMTVLGGLCGTILYWLIPDNQFTILSLLLVFVFFTVYLFQIYHLMGVFALTGFVVFLFAMLGNWDFTLLRDRILETALGAAIALTVSSFFLPTKSNIRLIFMGHIEKMQASLNLAFKKNIQSELISSQQLYFDFQALRKAALIINYEVMFHRINRRDFFLLMTESGFCTQYVISLIEAYRWLGLYLTEEDKLQVTLMLHTTQHNLHTLKLRLEKKNHPQMMQTTNLTDLLTKAITREPERFSSMDIEVVGFFNLMYFFTRLNIRLNNIYGLLGKMND